MCNFLVLEWIQLDTLLKRKEPHTHRSPETHIRSHRILPGHLLCPTGNASNPSATPANKIFVNQPSCQCLCEKWLAMSDYFQTRKMRQIIQLRNPWSTEILINKHPRLLYRSQESPVANTTMAGAGEPPCLIPPSGLIHVSARLLHMKGTSKGRGTARHAPCFRQSEVWVVLWLD